MAIYICSPAKAQGLKGKPRPNGPFPPSPASTRHGRYPGISSRQRRTGEGDRIMMKGRRKTDGAAGAAKFS